MLHDTRFPGETDAYREARDALLESEIDLRRRIEAVGEQRRALPLGGEIPTDYVFSEWDAAVGSVRTTRMSELFAPGKDSLFLYSFMFNPGPDGERLGVPCPVCTSIIDGIDGAVRHLDRNVNFGVVAKAPVERFAAHGRARGWRSVRLLSSGGTTFNRDYHAETDDEEQFASASVFVRRDGRIHHFWSSELWHVPSEAGQHPRHVDFMWPMWAILDRTPEGRGAGWMPELTYG